MEIPLSSFIDFVLKSGSPKMTCAKKIKALLDNPYDPLVDYYKRFREAVQELHRENRDKSTLLKTIGSLPDNKIENYRTMVAGYRKFLGNKEVKWFDPPRKKWQCSNVEIPINPEIGLEWNNQKHLIKLYLKADKPSKDRFSSILGLMKHTFKTDEMQYCLLDVRNGNFTCLKTKCCQ